MGRHGMKIFLIGGAGYCGSRIAAAIREVGHTLITLDTRAGCNYRLDYRALARRTDGLGRDSAIRDLLDSDVVLWFAGRSSVAKAADDPIEALSENCLGLVQLRSAMRPDSRLIYASTASLYSVTGPEPPCCGEETPIACRFRNAYDESKFSFDTIQQGFLPNCIGLRMGTVCGWGHTLDSTRFDTCFNAMCKSALETGVINVTHPESWRTLLRLPDLVEVVMKLLQCNVPYNILNVGTVNVSMIDLAETIAETIRECVGRECQINVIDSKDAPTYSFRMDLARQESLLRRSMSRVRSSSWGPGLDSQELYWEILRFNNKWRELHNADNTTR